ncbi:hypothetical protein [Streptomyces sp. SAI-127]|uniref:hypothetical protein n=1 Tax=Streptomyces sp. SAI-127 TaxID=2940543 RepID=UPI0024733FF3|nr:hypothetical protein [Streptomyces sp. SAI-127]
MDAAAQDDGERTRNRAKLYAPPRGQRRPTATGERPTAQGMSLEQAQALMSAVATEDAQVTGGRNG